MGIFTRERPVIYDKKIYYLGFKIVDGIDKRLWKIKPMQMRTIYFYRHQLIDRFNIQKWMWAKNDNTTSYFGPHFTETRYYDSLKDAIKSINF